MNKVLIFFTALILLGGCAQYSYLPHRESVWMSPYGSYIKVYMVNNKILHGEFLALNGDSLVIRNENKPSLYYVDTSSVKSYYIQFCKTPVFALPPLISISHGLFMVFTVPINTIIAMIMKEKDKKESRFRNLPFEQVRAYARFPEGMPESYR